MGFGYYQSIDIPFYIFVIAAILVLATYIWRFKESPGAKQQVYALLFKAVWMLCLVLSFCGQTLSDKLIWIYIGYLSALFLPYYYYTIILELSNQRSQLAIFTKYGILAIIGLEDLAIIFNPWHIFYQDVFLDGNAVNFVLGWLVPMSRISTYLIVVLALVLSGQWILRSSGMRRKQALWFTLAVSTTVVGTICLVFVPQLRKIHPVPLFSLLSALFMSWGFYRWHVYDIMPVAQKTIVKNMIDGLLIVDEEGYIADINDSAKNALVGLPTAIGSKFESVIAAWPALGKFNSNHASSFVEIAREYQGKTYYYQVEQILLKTANHTLGVVVILKDVTRQKQAQVIKGEEQKALAILTERNRLSREIHDSQGQFPGYVNIQTQMVELFLKKGQVAEAVTQLDILGEAAEATFRDVWESIAGFKQGLPEWDFFKTLDEWLWRFQKNCSITVSYNEPQYIPPNAMLPEVEVQLLRIIQEALTNVRKHSGASQVVLDFVFADHWLHVTITDNGCGFGVQKTSRFAKFGLTILKERAMEFGGACKITSVLSQGTMVKIEVPLESPV